MIHMSYIPPLLTVREVANALRLTPAQVRRLIAQGELEGFKLGSRQGSSLRVPAQALAEWLESEPEDAA
jgi:excisionase family DNA binding protein